MAPSFGRSISFPLQAATRRRHVRSISLPCRSHPLLGHLQTHITAVRAWAAQPDSSASAGLAHIGALHAALADLLDLPEAQEAARSSDRLLDALLLLADAYGSFQDTLLALKADVADVQAALRRRNGDAATRLASAVRSQRRNDKDLTRLSASLLSSSLCKTTNNLAEAAETAATLMDAAAASAAASAAVFSALASMSSASSSSSKKTAPFAAAFTKKEATTAVDEVKIQELAQCIHRCEAGSDMVFRTILRTRVSLLNIRTPAI